MNGMYTISQNDVKYLIEITLSIRSECHYEQCNNQGDNCNTEVT